MEFKDALKRYNDQLLLVNLTEGHLNEAREELEGQDKNLVETALDIERSLTLEHFKAILSWPEDDARKLIDKLYDIGRKVWEAHFDYSFTCPESYTLGLASPCNHFLQCTDPSHHEEGKLCVRVVGYTQKIGNRILHRIHSDFPFGDRPLLTLRETKATPEMKAFEEGVMRRRTLSALGQKEAVSHVVFRTEYVDIDWSDEDSDALYDKLVAEGQIVPPNGQSQ